MKKLEQQTINHVAFAIDASGSMHNLVREVVKVADQQIADLAALSTQLDQETRVTIYVFADNVTCLLYDRDVLRLGSIADFYEANGQTALIDATLKAHEDLTKTAVLYGDHAFLLYVLTDGQENASRPGAVGRLQATLKSLTDVWTVACLVPSQSAKFTVTKYGFPAGNVAVWDASSEAGMREAGETMRTATANYMNSRAAGVKSTTGLFTMDASTVNHKTVAQHLKEITTGIEILPVKAFTDITTFITKTHKRTFRQGKYYFPLIKPEKVGPQKNVVVRHKISGKVFGGPEVRTLLGLPDHEIRIKPGINAEYDVFVQSTSTNRNLIAGYDLLVIE